MTNPLLTAQELPPFSSIKAEHIQPAVEQAIAKCRDKIEAVLAAGGPYTWENLVAPWSRWTMS